MFAEDKFLINLLDGLRWGEKVMLGKTQVTWTTTLSVQVLSVSRVPWHYSRRTAWGQSLIWWISINP